MAKAENSESAAFEKTIQGLRMAEEGATEVGIHLDDGDWMKVSRSIQAMRLKIVELRMAAASRRIRA